jgi:hypothetical protein
MTLEAEVEELVTLFNACHRCNRAILEALDAGQGPDSLVGLFQQKQAFTDRLEALTPHPEAVGALDAVRDAFHRLGQAQANAIRSEALVAAALQPHISYHGKRRNPYQQPSGDLPKNGWDREG